VIAALARGVSFLGDDLKRQVSDTHFKFEGTSMSAPHVTGIIALILEHNNTLTAAQMKALLTNNASLDTANNVSGFGRVNAQAAVTNIAADTSGFAGIGDLSEDSTSNGSIGASSSSGCSLGAANSTWAELAIILISLMFLIAHRKLAFSRVSRFRKG
jgi:subtilase family serine protease